MISDLIARLMCPARDAIGRALLRLGLTPNVITLLGMLFTVGVGVAAALGQACWRPWAFTLVIAAGACDMLDGAMAKLGDRRTRFGAIFDSTCDRVGDAALYLGPAFYYIVRPDAPPGTPANLTLVGLAGLGLLWAYLISYIRARASNEGLRADGGFWQRPERIVTVWLGLGFHHLPTALWILGIAPAATVLHRLWRVRQADRPQPALWAVNDYGPPGLAGVLLFRWPRGTLAFDIQAGATILALLFWDLPAIDPLRTVLGGLVGG